MEHQFHNWLKSQIQPNSYVNNVLVGIGDDGAVLSPNQQATVVATDSIAQGTHFDLSRESAELVGRKALAVNLSDLAAMAAQPFAAVLNFTLPREPNHFESDTFELAKKLFAGVQELAQQFSVSIVGGDTNTWDGPLVISATVFGHRHPNLTGWSIDGVQPGDGIVVSGTFGGSIHGRHLSFEPRIELANYLSANYNINAATDASDSLSLDMNAMAKASGVGIDFAMEAIPVSPDVRENDPTKAIEHALSDGEDFELILAVRQTEIADLMSDKNVPCQLTVLGAATDLHQELQTLDHHGNSITYTPKGYIH
jgi:thiamine-monophosphate kinase